MCRKSLFVLLAVMLLLLPGMVFARGGAEQATEDSYDAWMRFAEVGPYQPEVEDWDAIHAAAIEEPPMVIYANTSRAFPQVEKFNEIYGLDVEMLNIRSAALNERLRREYDAGIHTAGVAMLANLPDVYQQLMVERDALTNYVPRDLQERIVERDMEPLLIHRYSVDTWYYKPENPGEAPYENIWELTTERFRNRIATLSPAESSGIVNFMISVVDRSDWMAEQYQDFFGEPIELTTENAGYEWIKRFLANDVRIMAGTRDVAEAVTNADPPFIGRGTQSVYRDVIEGLYDFEIDTEILPTMLSDRPIAMGSFTRSPNTAKLLIRYLTSQEGGEPWWGADFPVDPQVQTSGPMADLTLSSFTRLWTIPLEDSLTLGPDVTDFWLIHE